MSKTAKTGLEAQVTTPDLFVLLANICRQLQNHPSPQAGAFVAQILKLIGETLERPPSDFETRGKEILELVLIESKEIKDGETGKSKEIRAGETRGSKEIQGGPEEMKDGVAGESKEIYVKSKEIDEGSKEITAAESSKSKEKILALLRENPSLSTRELAGSLELSHSGVEKNLRDLKAGGQIRRIGPMRGRGGRWEIIVPLAELPSVDSEVSAEVLTVQPAPVLEPVSESVPTETMVPESVTKESPVSVPEASTAPAAPSPEEVASPAGDLQTANPEMLIHQVMTAYNASQQAYIDAWKRRDPNAKLLLQRQKQLGDQVSRLQAADLQKLSAEFQAQRLQFQATNAQLEQSLADLQRLSKRANRIVDVAAKIDQIILLVAKVVK